MEIGLLSLGDLLDDPVTGVRLTPAQRHRSLVDQAVTAEAVGLHAVHLGEHHACDYVLSAPPVVLAAIGERTSTLRLSTGVTLAANLDPVRVAEDYATVDALSDGRVEIVAGRGNAFRHTYELFGQDPDDARRRFDEAVELLLRLLREEDVTWTGETRAPLDGVTVHPRPTGELPVWVGGGLSPESAALAARLGCPIMLPSVFAAPEVFAPAAEAYRTAWTESGRDPADAVVGACCHMWIAPTSAGAREAFLPRYARYWGFVDELIRASSGFSMHPDPEAFLDGPAIVGSPAEVVDRLGRWRELLGVDRQICMFDLGGMPLADVLASIELLGSEVLPQLDPPRQPGRIGDGAGATG